MLKRMPAFQDLPLLRRPCVASASAGGGGRSVTLV